MELWNDEVANLPVDIGKKIAENDVYYPVRNRDYRQWRKAKDRGGDFLINSCVRWGCPLRGRWPRGAQPGLVAQTDAWPGACARPMSNGWPKAWTRTTTMQTPSLPFRLKCGSHHPDDLFLQVKEYPALLEYLRQRFAQFVAHNPVFLFERANDAVCVGVWHFDQ